MFAECSGRFLDSFKWNLLLAIIEDGATEEGGEAFLARFAAEAEADGDPAGQHVSKPLRRVG
ncbi:MAG: hypothetical protein C0456_02135 [Hyphomonas sp.]|nr:hypothetical protein [Hyphomonas sp.]